MRLAAEAGAARWSEALRWGTAAAVVLAAHGAVLTLLMRRPVSDPLSTGGTTAIAIDLEPVEADESKAVDDTPATDQASAMPTAAAPAAADAAASAATAAPTETAPHAPPPPPPQPIPPAPAVDPPPDAVAEPPSRPAVAPPTSVAVAPPAQASAASTAAQAVDEETPAARRTIAGAETAWRGRLVAHINRFRRFPPGLGSGTTRIGFGIDRQGRVTGLHVVGSSGSAALDEAARAIVARASPFPAPPASTDDRSLVFVVPIHFDGRHP